MPPTSRSRARPWSGPLLLTALCAALAARVESLRALPFSSTDDAPMYFLPLIKAQTDALLAGDLPRMVWELGAGWTPLESGQTGLLYPPYYVSNLLARLLGHPLWILEVNAWLHVWAAGLVVYAGLPATLRARERFAWGALAMVQPAPFILGLNWHNYLTPYPWFLAALLLVLRQREVHGRWSVRAELGLAACCVGLFVTAHPQMYVLGAGVLGALVLAMAPRRAWFASLRALAVAQLPLLLPVLFLKLASTRATSNWMAGRGDPEFFLREAQSLATFLHGSLFGNLLGDGGFRLWKDVPTVGVGMFFCPLLFVAAGFALRRRQWGWAALVVGLGMLLSLRTFPWLGHVGLNALGMRWTWKLTVLTAPLALVTVAAVAHQVVTSERVRLAALGVLTLASAAVCVHGLGFEIWPAYQVAHPLGAERMAGELRTTLERAGVPHGARLALVARETMDTQGLPLAILAAVGNGPLLAGYETVHLYEPLESDVAARAHHGLSTPWRIGIDPAEYRQDRARWEARLRAVGAQVLVTAVPGTLEPAKEHAVEDVLGRVTYVQQLEGAGLTYPWAWGREGTREPLTRLGGGRLETPVPWPYAPPTAAPRPIDWTRREDGRWVGVPRTVPTTWWVGEVALVLVAVALTIVRPPRRRLLADAGEAQPQRGAAA